MSVSASDGYIHVNYSGVSNVYEALVDTTQTIGALLQDLQQQLQPLQASWIGVSQEEYANVQARWNSDLADMTTTLSKSAAVLEEMSSNYGTTDTNLGFQWSQILT